MNSLRAQLTLRLLLSAALLLGASGMALHWQMRRALTHEFDTALRASAQSISAITEQKSGEIIIEFGGETMPQFQRNNGSDIYLMRTLDGREVARSPSLGNAKLPLRTGSPVAPDYFNITLIDGRTSDGSGVIRPATDPMARPDWPEAFWLLQNRCRQSLTLEAPSDFPLANRVAALSVAVDCALQKENS